MVEPTTDASPKYLKLIWGVPVLLCLLQAWQINASLERLFYEEIAESIRNVYWLEEREIYDGVSSNIGWYGLLLSIYKTFGFSIYTAKVVRLCLYAVAIFSLTWSLIHCFGAKKAILPLFALGLSPTWLYFNTYQTTYGLDLTYAAILLPLLISHRQNPENQRSGWRLFTIGILTCMGATTYPAFLLYLPFIVLSLCWPGDKHAFSWPLCAKQLLRWSAGFLTPLALATLYLKEPGRLFYDPEAKGTGLFRAGGMGLSFSLETLQTNLLQVFKDLFERGSSYYFSLPYPEFGGPLSWLSIVACGLICAQIWKKRVGTPYLLYAGIGLLILSAVLPNLSSLFPGLRRCTGLIAGFYILYTLAASSAFGFANKTLRNLCFLGMLALPIDHLLAFQRNLSQLKIEEQYNNYPLLGTEPLPKEALDEWLSFTQAGKAIDCNKEVPDDHPCKLSEIFGALQGYRVWNGQNPTPIYAKPRKYQENIELKLETWRSGDLVR